MEQRLPLGVCRPLDQSEHLRCIEDGTAFVGRAASDVVEARPVVTAALAVAFGDVEGDGQRCSPKLVGLRPLPAGVPIHQARCEGEEPDRGLVGIQVFMMQLRVRVHHLLVSDRDGDGDGNGCGEAACSAVEEVFAPLDDFRKL